MSREDQDRFEDYLEIEQFLAELQAGHVVHPPEGLTPDQARIYQVAILFRAASTEASEIRPEFAQRLQSRLEDELLQSQIHLLPRVNAKLRKPRVSRRTLLAGGVTIAASVTVGAGLERMMEPASGQTGHPAPGGPLISNGVPTRWVFVTTEAELGNHAVKFVTESLVGYAIRHDDDDGDPQDRGKVIAMSAACTHLGCIVQWSKTDRTFHCPCHNGVFTEYGKTDPKSASLPFYLAPLPRLEVNVVEGKIYARVPRV